MKLETIIMLRILLEIEEILEIMVLLKVSKINSRRSSKIGISIRRSSSNINNKLCILLLAVIIFQVDLELELSQRMGIITTEVITSGYYKWKMNLRRIS